MIALSAEIYIESVNSGLFFWVIFNLVNP
jgi:hypothetical protein